MTSTELIKLPPSILYDVATDIQVADKWKEFAFNIGFTTENVMLIEQSRSERFPAENILYHWFARNPKLKDLINILLSLKLEKPLYRLKNAGLLQGKDWRLCERKIDENRRAYENEFEKSLTYLESENFNLTTESTNKIQAEKQTTATATTTTTTISTTSTALIEPVVDETSPSAGMIDVEPHLSSIARSSFKRALSIAVHHESKDFDKSCPFLSCILSLLEYRSVKFDSEELDWDDIDLKTDKFVTTFSQDIRSIKFEIRSYSIKKILQKFNLQIQLMNIIWSETTFRLCQLPILTGYSLKNDYLFLFYKDTNCNSLFKLLHRSPNVESKRITTTTLNSNYEPLSFRDRFVILQSIGEALSFMHKSIPFGAYHGDVSSKNVYVANGQVYLGGLNNFYTQHPNYLKVREFIEQEMNRKEQDQEQDNNKNNNKNNKINPDEIKQNIDVEKLYYRDIFQFNELICEIFWNIQPNKSNKYIEQIHFQMKQEDNSDADNDEEDSLSEYIKKDKPRPKVEYIGWNSTVHSKLCDLIQEINDKHISIAEILEQLKDIYENTNNYENEPPPYDFTDFQEKDISQED